MALHQASLKQFSTRLQTSYQKIVHFEAPAAAKPTKALPQMPKFQIDHFLKQALAKQLPVTVQFNDFDHGGQNALNGKFKQQAAGPIIFQAANHKLFHLVTANAIRYIALQQPAATLAKSGS
ncbi:hypothetical protein [Loigolactobacillus rennini]|nr:hypothetical protein [Loigolactobacillus rennini]SFZ88182.1 hypothetical protein LREN565_1295 [Loigolactobacillus rennini]